MAFTKKEKQQMIEQYGKWVRESQALYVLTYSGMRMKDIDTLRARARENGSEIHVIKNTLMSQVLEKENIPGNDLFEGPSIVGFAFEDVPGLAKVLSDVTKGDIFTIKGGLMGKQPINASQVKALADLPPLPVVRAQLLGVLCAPASRLARTLAEPARGLAAVIKARSEQGAEAPAQAA